MSLFEVYKSSLTSSIRESVWKRDHNTCQRCGLVSRYYPTYAQISEGWDPFLVIHHIDRNRFNNRPENLKLVCQVCHVKEHNGEWGNTGKARKRGVSPSRE